MLANWYLGCMIDLKEEDAEQAVAKLDTQLRGVLAELVPPEAVEREYDLVMQAMDHIGPQPRDCAPLQ